VKWIFGARAIVIRVVKTQMPPTTKIITRLFTRITMGIIMYAISTIGLVINVIK
jgi:hypothetical protein